MEPSGGSGYYLFGRDITRIPCLRTCVLTGFTAGFGTSLMHYLFTSNAIRSFRLGPIVFVVVTFPYWFICRENEYQKELMIYQAQKEISNKTKEEFIYTDSLEFGPETFG